MAFVVIVVGVMLGFAAFFELVKFDDDRQEIRVAQVLARHVHPSAPPLPDRLARRLIKNQLQDEFEQREFLDAWWPAWRTEMADKATVDKRISWIQEALRRPAWM